MLRQRKVLFVKYCQFYMQSIPPSMPHWQDQDLVMTSPRRKQQLLTEKLYINLHMEQTLSFQLQCKGIILPLETLITENLFTNFLLLLSARPILKNTFHALSPNTFQMTNKTCDHDFVPCTTSNLVQLTLLCTLQ